MFNGSAIAHRGYANHDVMAAAKGAVAGQPALTPSPLFMPVFTPVRATVGRLRNMQAIRTAPLCEGAGLSRRKAAFLMLPGVCPSWVGLLCRTHYLCSKHILA